MRRRQLIFLSLVLVILPASSSTSSITPHNRVSYLSTNGFDITLVKKVKGSYSSWSENVSINVGETVEFSIMVTNTGSEAAPLLNVHVVDVLPSNLVYNYDASITPDYASDHRLEWFDIGPLYRGESKTIYFNATAVKEGCCRNYANVSCCMCGYPYDEDVANVTIKPAPSPSINITKLVRVDSRWVKEGTFYVCDDVEFKILVVNDGDINLTGVHVVDNLPSFLVYNGDANITPYYSSDHRVEWIIDELNVSEKVEIVFSAHAVSVGEEENQVDATACQSTGDSDEVHIIIAGLVAEKEAWDSIHHRWVDEIDASIGDTIRFRVTISYIGNGSYMLYDIHVRDDLPECLEYADNANPPETALHGKTIWWNLSDSLSAGSSIVVEFDAIIIETSGCGPCINRVNVSGRECSGRVFYDEDTAMVNAECPLRADAGGPYFGETGEAIYIVGSADGGTPPYTYKWDLDDDGSYDDYIGRSLYYSWSEPGTYVISLKVEDSVGRWDTDSTTVTIYPPENSPPNTPSKPVGVTSGLEGISYTYRTSTVDPDDDLIRYGWDWDGDGTIDEWTPYYHSGETISVTHSWSTPGTYHVKVKAEDINGAQSGFSSPLTVTITSNNPPMKPSISGPTKGRIGVSYTYTATTIDSDGDEVWYLFDWGDGTNSGWLGPYASGQTASASHIWSSLGSYSVKVKARDDPNGDGDFSDGAESIWSDPLLVSMSKSRILLEKLKELIPPILFKLLNQRVLELNFMI